MLSRSTVFAILAAFTAVSVSGSQYPMLDMIAQKVIQRYESSTCEQLWEARGKPKTAEQQNMIQILQERSADAHRVPQRGRGADRQQDVHLRDDPMMFSSTLPGTLAVALLSAVAHAGNTVRPRPRVGRRSAAPAAAAAPRDCNSSRRQSTF